MKVRNPRTGEFDYEVEESSSDEVCVACQRGRDAVRKTGWATLSVGERLSELEKLKDGIMAAKSELVEVLYADTGRRDVSEGEVDGVVTNLNRWIERGEQAMALPDPLRASIPFYETSKQVVPYELIGVISPWNIPFLLALIDAIPALVAGCALVVKPSEITPRFIPPLRALIDYHCPLLSQGIIQFVVGGPATGQALIDSVDLVVFTGSVRVGKLVSQQAASRMIPCFLELGGKDPAIVTATADIEAASSAIVWGSLVNSGQSCQSIERVYVEESVADEFIMKVKSKAEQVTSSKKLGPMITLNQLELIQAQLADAVSKGATILCGGNSTGPDDPRGQYVLEPAVVTGVNHSMQLMTEETFGPVIPIMRCHDVATMVELANDSIYGLSGAVFGEPQTARSIARELRVGAVSINDSSLTIVLQESEKSAFGLSGVGVMSRMGDTSVKRFLRSKALMEKVVDTRDPWWFN